MCPSAASAQQMNQESVLSLQASQQAVAGHYQQAIRIYDQLIHMDPRDADHYIQRALLYRQIKNNQQSVADASVALQLAEYRLQKRSSGKRAAKYYWQRSQAHRLLHQFSEAEADIRKAIQLRRDQRYLPDLQAIVLESKIYKAGR